MTATVLETPADIVTTATHPGRIRHLDGIRGLAALAVVLDHYFGSLITEPGLAHTVGRLAATGWLGVDVFFTLSGFLITGILQDTPRQKGFFSRFYVRRAYRLAPLYYVYIALIAVLEVATHSLHVTSMVANIFYLQDFYIAWVGHWVTGTGLLWSLAIEEQFYLLWPAALFRWSARHLAPALLLAALLSMGLRVYLQLSGKELAAYVLPFSHLDGLCLGALLAFAVRGVDPFQLRRCLPSCRLVALGCLLLLYVFAHTLDHSAVLFGGAAPVLVAVLTAGLVVEPGVWQTALELPALLWLGRYSYAFYVLQFLPGILLQHRLFQLTHSLLLRTVGNILLILLVAAEAKLSWILLESRFMRLRDKLHP